MPYFSQADFKLKLHVTGLDKQWERYVWFSMKKIITFLCEHRSLPLWLLQPEYSKINEVNTTAVDAEAPSVAKPSTARALSLQDKQVIVFHSYYMIENVNITHVP